MITNSDIAKLLRRVEAVYEVKDKDFFRGRAYENATNAIENLTISAHDLWEQGKLTEIPGVGESLADHLDELFKTGKVKHFESEFKRVPAGMFGLLGIRGIGPKIAQRIVMELKDKMGDFGIIEGADLREGGDVVDALTGLGYSRFQAQQALQAIPASIQGVENKVKEALKILGK